MRRNNKIQKKKEIAARNLWYPPSFPLPSEVDGF